MNSEQEDMAVSICTNCSISCKKEYPGNISFLFIPLWNDGKDGIITHIAMCGAYQYGLSRFLIVVESGPPDPPDPKFSGSLTRV